MRPVLYLSFDGLTDPLGQSQILPYVVALSKHHYRFTIISFEKKENFAKNNGTIRQLCKNHSIAWKFFPYHNSPPLVSTLFDLRKLWSTAKKWCEVNPDGFIHCRSYLTPLVAIRLKKRFGTRFIFDMRGFWADERVEGKLWNLNNPIFKQVYRFFKRKEYEFLHKADAIVTLTEKARDFIAVNMGVEPGRISVIPCSVDLELFDPQRISESQKIELRQQLGLTEKDYVVVYLGSLGTWYLYEDMIQAFKDLRRNQDHVKFLILTPDLDRVGNQPDVIALSVARKDVPLYCSISNASILFIKPSFSKMASSATKMAEVMAMGLPVITNKGWGDLDAFQRDGANLFFYEARWPENARVSTKHREFVIRHLSLETAVVRYHDIYRSLARDVR